MRILACGTGKRPKYTVTERAPFSTHSKTLALGRSKWPAVNSTSMVAPPILQCAGSSVLGSAAHTLAAAASKIDSRFSMPVRLDAARHGFDSVSSKLRIAHNVKIGPEMIADFDRISRL